MALEIVKLTLFPAGMPDSIPNVDYTIVSMPAKQRIKVAARAAGSVRAANARAHQLRRKIHVDQQESAIPINHEIQLGQPWSDKSGALDSSTSSFPVIDDSLQQCTNMCSSAQNGINQQIQHGKPTSNKLNYEKDNCVFALLYGVILFSLLFMII